MLLLDSGYARHQPALYKTALRCGARFYANRPGGVAPVAIVVHPSQPMSNLADLVALAKAMPGKLN